MKTFVIQRKLGSSGLNLGLSNFLFMQVGYGLAEGELEEGQSVVGHLVQEFDHRTQVFNDDAEFLVEVKSGISEASLNPDEELRKLNVRFATWKKDFKLRLRETRLVLQKLGNLESAEKSKRKWWGKRTHP
jgi:myosin-5